MPEGVARQPLRGTARRLLPDYGLAVPRTEQANHIYGLIGGVTASIFAADLLTPLGITIWVFYLIPVLFCFLLRQRLVPLALGSLVTVLMALGITLSPAGVEPGMVAVNRSLGVVTIWAMVYAAYLFIGGKLAVQRQEWLQAGQVGLAERMSGELSVPQLCDAILRYFAGHLGAQVGAMFVRDDQVFRRRATYAVPIEEAVPREIRPGEGLVGEAVENRRVIHLNALPDGYLRFGSGLGTGQPRTILVAPIEVDGEINAAIEFGFAGKVSEAQLEMVERVTNAIGVAVRSAEYRVRLRQLLEETQRQTEELQKQGEELRSSNEELEELSRTLEASQAALEQQQHELEQTNAQLEDRTRALEAQRADLQRSEAALQAQAQELEQASRYKSEFLANMSHELRTPLNSSLIMARLLADNRDGNLTAEQVRYAETIESSGIDLLTLINDVLDLSKIEAGRAEVQPERVDLVGLMERLRRNFEPVARQRGLAFQAEVSEGAPAAIETDPLRLEQVLRNFISNALKFTEAGEVAVEVQVLPDGQVTFCVRDTGIGIAPEQQEVIFEAFRQADGTTSRRYGGTGLGLSISRELARILGGRIELTSVPGHGSTFTLVVPPTYDAARTVPLGGQVLALGPPEEPRARTSPSTTKAAAMAALVRAAQAVEDDRATLTGDNRVILVVEDDLDFACILRDLAREQGFRCLIAETADEGVAMAQHYLPHAVILDIGLPDHSGLSVLDRLKRNIQTRHIPVHIVSGQENAQTALAQGATGFMLKPVRREQLAETLGRLEQRLDRKVRRVLVVDEDRNQLDAMRRLLVADGVETIGAMTGAACLEQLALSTFDCMVLGLTLPDMSGFELLDRLSADDTRSFPPVIVYTGQDLAPADELRLRHHSKSIIVKGAKSPERLLDEVTLFLHQVVSELPREQQRTLARALSRDAAIEGRRILVAEDDVRNVFALTSIFEPHGATVTIARNGREAIEALERAEAAGEPIDLVLMDIMMPEMDGLSATREIRRRPAWKGLPVIALTAKAMADDHAECLAAGANDYMSKPLDVEKLVSLVRVWMPR